jgi:predicted RNase H-like HicB family nuclease
MINLKYTYEMDGDFFVGYLDDYPEFPTQGENLEDFEKNLLDIYEMIQNGTLDVPQKLYLMKFQKMIDKKNPAARQGSVGRG